MLFNRWNDKTQWNVTLWKNVVYNRLNNNNNTSRVCNSRIQEAFKLYPLVLFQCALVLKKSPRCFPFPQAVDYSFPEWLQTVLISPSAEGPSCLLLVLMLARRTKKSGGCKFKFDLHPLLFRQCKRRGNAHTGDPKKSVDTPYRVKETPHGCHTLESWLDNALY